MTNGEARDDFVSFWMSSHPGSDYPALQGDLRADVVIVGAGIVGITTAYLLTKAGLDVVIVDRGRIAAGVTGYTTAKITSSHGLIYGKLHKKFGEEGARVYATSNQAAIEKIAALVDEHSIDSDFERADNYVYAVDGSRLEEVEREARVAADLGLPASFTTETELPFDVLGAVRFAHQAQFHPRKYLSGLAAEVTAGGGRIFENTIVTNAIHGDPCRVETTHGSIRADDVVISTHMPILDRGLYFTKVHPYRSYVVAGPVPQERAPQGMYISADEPTRSIRSTPYGDKRLVLVGGEGHRTGNREDTSQQYRALEDSAREWYGISTPAFRWAAQDNVSVDGVPYIGPLTCRSERIRVATGFGKWGMTNGTLAAMLLSDAIAGRPNEWSGFYRSTRIDPLPSATSFLTENLEVAKHFMTDRLNPRTSGNPRCTHLGCVLRSNLAEGTWDCPCHGSRFAADGTVIHGPAIKDLELTEDL